MSVMPARRGALAALAAVFAVVIPVTHAAAAKHVRHRAPVVHLRAPSTSAPVPVDGVLHARAIVRRLRAARVVFRIDGHRVGSDRTRPYALRRPVAGLSTGRHSLRAIAVTRRGRRAAATRAFTVGERLVTRAAAAPLADPSDSQWKQGRTWASSFETGDFSEWSWWGQGQQDLWGHIAVIDPTREGVPRLGGDHVARFETTPDDIAAGRDNAKLYRGFGTALRTDASRPPTDVSGVYSAWFYFPPTYHVPDHTTVMPFQFKEEYRTSNGPVSDPLWWIQLGPVHWADSMSRGYGEDGLHGRSDAPAAFINHPGNDWSAKQHFVAVPLGRWVSVAAVLHQGNRVDFYLDGRYLDTGRASQYPVSPFHGADSLAWTFGIGNYSTGANGPLYADRASYTAVATGG